MAVPTLFAKVLNINTVPVLARAEAASLAQNCVYAIAPSSSGAATVSSGTSVAANCGIVVESTSSSAASCTSASVTATQILLTGSGSASSCSYSPTPTLGATVPSPADPLPSLATPSIGSCGTSTASPYTGSKTAISIPGSATLNPGVYCGGITVKRGATVALNAGTYILKTSSSNALAIDVGATVTGTGVIFYNCGSGAITFGYTSFPSSSGGVDLVAPTSGTYAGILFFQDSGNATTATILGTSSWSTILQGVAYFPAATVNYTYSGTAAYNALDAYDINFAYSSSASTGTSTFAKDSSSASGGSPLTTSGAVLVQ